MGLLEVPPSTELELSGPRGKLELFWKDCGFAAIQVSDGERQLWMLEFKKQNWVSVKLLFDARTERAEVFKLQLYAIEDKLKRIHWAREAPGSVAFLAPLAAALDYGMGAEEFVGLAGFLACPDFGGAGATVQKELVRLDAAQRLKALSMLPQVKHPVLHEFAKWHDSAPSPLRT